jgi:hypothetical protein
MNGQRYKKVSEILFFCVQEYTISPWFCQTPVKFLQNLMRFSLFLGIVLFFNYYYLCVIILFELKN